ncbi:hypothetical protein T492DRAFT_886373 [Pavlovales sp. CCMP2436]|nr:hypothetical protein T492DRAFT_886373 [Pavlovales sp. CCMP2436]
MRREALESTVRHEGPAGDCLRFSTAVETNAGFSIAGQALLGRAVYLDAQATTPLDPRVLDAMMPHMLGMYGNPHSKSHAYGWEAADSVDVARKQVITACH